MQESHWCLRTNFEAGWMVIDITWITVPATIFDRSDILFLEKIEAKTRSSAISFQILRNKCIHPRFYESDHKNCHWLRGEVFGSENPWIWDGCLSEYLEMVTIWTNSQRKKKSELYKRGWMGLFRSGFKGKVQLRPMCSQFAINVCQWIGQNSSRKRGDSVWRFWGLGPTAWRPTIIVCLKIIVLGRHRIGA